MSEEHLVIKGARVTGSVLTFRGNPQSEKLKAYTFRLNNHMLMRPSHGDIEIEHEADSELLEILFKYLGEDKAIRYFEGEITLSVECSTGGKI